MYNVLFPTIAAICSLMENVVKECMEEASIPESIARTAVCSGAITYTDADASGRLGRDVLFCYDLELAEDFVPRPCDGEVQSFELKCIDWVVDTIVARRSDHEFKPNINVTIIDFLIRYVKSNIYLPFSYKLT